MKGKDRYMIHQNKNNRNITSRNITSTDNPLLQTRHGSVVMLTLNRPAVLNAIDLATARQRISQLLHLPNLWQKEPIS